MEFRSFFFVERIRVGRRGGSGHDVWYCNDATRGLKDVMMPRPRIWCKLQTRPTPITTVARSTWRYRSSKDSGF